MTDEPLVSVVMSVYNGAGTLASTMDSVLTQQGVSFELIVIDDGSTDGSGAILDDYARQDDRVRVIHQANTGLTRALIRGCAEARGDFIARQDASDLSLPGRLACQSAFLESNPQVVMSSCGTRFIGPRGELLYEVIQQLGELQQGLGHLTLELIRGPSHHGSTMFRRVAYDKVGGYRSDFPVAQDLDLWMRLAELGPCLAIPEVYYQAAIALGSISHTRRKGQLKATETILKLAEIRRMGGDEVPVLKQLRIREIRAKPGWFQRPIQNAYFYYFLGSLLSSSQPAQARFYFKQALKSWPFFPRALLKFFMIRS